jgi:ketosteroid isomerase-like protein
VGCPPPEGVDVAYPLQSGWCGLLASLAGRDCARSVVASRAAASHVEEGAMDKDRIARNLECVEKHFHSEAVNEVEAALALYTDDIAWEAPALNGLDRSFSGKAAVAENYRELFASMHDVRFELLQRFATEDRVVDDSLVTFEVIRGGYWHFPVGSKIEMRLVHIFEMRDGRISRELVFDMGRPQR